MQGIDQGAQLVYQHNPNGVAYKSKHSALKIMTHKSFRLAIAIFMSLLISACASNPSSNENLSILQNQAAKVSDSQLAQNYYARADRNGQYLIGGSDVLEIKVLGAEELDRVIRVSADGTISYPLIGRIRLSGLSVAESEDLIASNLGQNYLQNPQVSVYVTEYGANQVTVTGSVNKPNIYNLTQSRSLVEMIALAGGLTEEAGQVVRVNTTQVDPQTGEAKKLVLLLNIEELLSGEAGSSNFILSSGDSIFVPKAGGVFIEGAVEEPGSYPITENLSLRKALLLAGGVKWEADKSNVGIIRKGYNEPVVINYQQIEDDKAQDISIENGDLIIVNYNTPKRSLGMLFEGLARVVNVGVGYSPFD